MAGVSVEVGAITVQYFRPCDEIPEVAIENSRGKSALDRELILSPRVRRVLVHLLSWSPRQSYYGLHWSDGTDLEDLDIRVKTGSVTPSYFHGALLAEPRRITCVQCFAQVETLIVEPGVRLSIDDWDARLDAHAYIRECPVCHDRQSWPQLVVETFDL
jgi:hypothetical protein